MELPKNKRFKNLIGEKFERLEVFEYNGEKNKRHFWKCKCNCGNIAVIEGSKLKSSHTRSCGCLLKDKIREQCFVDLTGQKFGRLEVIEYAGQKKHGNQIKNVWKCKCECGNEVIVTIGNLKNKIKPVKSCGCLQKEFCRNRLINLVGQKFGELEVLKYSHQKQGHSYWVCKCKCGNIKTISGNCMRKGSSKSCGCKQGRFTHGMWGKPGYKKFINKDPIKKIRHNVSVAIRMAIQRTGNTKNGSVLKYLPYTIEELKKHLESKFEGWMTWDNYGDRNSSKRKTWHIDHIIPQVDFPYTSMEDPLFLECWSLSNLRPLEKIANLKKGSK